MRKKKRPNPKEGEMNALVCPSGHGVMEHRGVSQIGDPPQVFLQHYECRECGLGKDLATAENGDPALCDFCSSPDPVTVFQCKTFEADAIGLRPGLAPVVFPWGSQGGWAACERCARLVEAGNQPALTERSMNLLMAKHDVRGDEFRQMFRQMLEPVHQAFFRYRVSA